ncbi:MAG TPA: hypothetical protein VNC40_01165 [Gaiellaceae bacterium]|nr:hypothetical protein [Gaiellaceae bacterium]
MQTGSSRRWRLAALVLLAAALLLPAAVAAGHPKRAVHHRPAAAAGIVVHGRWTITVRNPDGRLVRRYAFENAYTGSDYLGKLLARQVSVGYWGINLVGGPCTALGCVLVEKGSQYPGQASGPLTVSVSRHDLVLQGALNAPGNGTIIFVGTLNASCSPTTAPATACAWSGSGTQFTSKKGLQVVIAAGQQIAVTVTISFS